MDQGQQPEIISIHVDCTKSKLLETSNSNELDDFRMEHRRVIVLAQDSSLTCLFSINCA